MSKLSGKLIKKMPVQSGISKSSGKEWSKQDFVIDTFGDYPKTVCLEGWSKMVEQLDNRNIGDLITVSFEPESREYNERWYTSLKCFRVELYAN